MFAVPEMQYLSRHISDPAFYELIHFPRPGFKMASESRTTLKVSSEAFRFPVTYKRVGHKMVPISRKAGIIETMLENLATCCPRKSGVAMTPGPTSVHIIDNPWSPIKGHAEPISVFSFTHVIQLAFW